MDTKALRQKILDLAIRGKLVPQDPNDEPASVLLERIREEKKQMVKDGKLKPKDIKNDTIIFKGEDNLHYEKFQDGTVKCIEDEIPFEVSEGWKWCRLSNICLILNGDRGKNYPAKSKLHTQGIPFVSASNISDGEVSEDGLLYLSDEQFNLLGAGKLELNDIVFCIRGSLGKCGFFRLDKGAIASSLVIVRTLENKDYLNGYVFYYLNSLFAYDEIHKYDNGSAQPNLAAKDFQNFLVPLPAYKEIERITKKCEELLINESNISIITEELKNCIDITKSKVLDLAIRGKLVPQDSNDEPASVLLERIRSEKEELIKQGKLRRDKKESIIFKGDDNSYYMTGKKEPLENAFDLPNGWIWASLPEVVFFQEGPGIMKKDFRDSGVPLIRISGLQTDKVSLEGCNYLDPEMVERKWKHFKLEMGDIVICTSASIGKVSIVDSETVGAIPYTGQIRFQMSPAITKDYFLYFAMSDIYLNQVNMLKTGNCIQHYGPTHLKQVIVPLPPIDEQIRISNAIKQYLMHLELISEQIC